MGSSGTVAGPASWADSVSALDDGTPVFEAADPRFLECIDPVARLERLYVGCRWAEGPVYFADQRSLIFSDIPNRRMLRYDEESGGVSLFRADSGHANGNTRDGQGRLITCEQGARRVTRTEPDGSVTVLVDAFEGRRLNSPNDVVVRSDGSIWFTDPDYGISTDFVGRRAEREQPASNVFRLDPGAGEIRAVASDFWKPNGLAFSPDESQLYVVDSGFLPDPRGPRHLRVFGVGARGDLSGGAVLAEVAPGIPDGVRLDTEGRLWVGAGDGVHCYDPDGTLLGKIRVGEAVANLAFGGPERNRLYLTATTSLYGVFVEARGAQRP
ncbi:SMP-30/gluconolactonase/LRE family protein [Leucobacter weissii]|uniref:SMP-30/gluconolactonase/LRE family protein n=1 Tax=Leucobacter weissii TaxID=1983706 RepID=A0A939SAV3_9MICO|nr:SMP-30/gluconolactonase/LRE family protein [Leucobacter weissii]